MSFRLLLASSARTIFAPILTLGPLARPTRWGGGLSVFGPYFRSSGHWSFAILLGLVVVSQKRSRLAASSWRAARNRRDDLLSVAITLVIEHPLLDTSADDSEAADGSPPC